MCSLNSWRWLWRRIMEVRSSAFRTQLSRLSVCSRVSCRVGGMIRSMERGWCERELRWRDVRFVVARKKLWKTADRAVMLAVASVIGWKVMSRLVSRVAMAESSVDGTRSSFVVISGVMVWVCGV